MSFRIDPRQPLTLEVRHILESEIGKALRHLADARERPENGLHNCRKRLKKVRGLLRLVRSGDVEFCKAENARYRDAAALLAGPREATALIETIDRLVAAFPDETERGGLDPIRERLVARRRDVLRADAGLEAAIDSATAACEEGLHRIEALILPDDPERAADVLAAGARKTMRRGGRALERAKARGTAEDFHDLRKAVKTHAMHLSLLSRLWPTSTKARRKAADALGDDLGDLHDVFVMRAMIEADDRPLGRKTETRLLARLLKRSEKRLRKTCLKEAAELFDNKPKRAARALSRKARADLIGGTPGAAGALPS